MQYLLDTNLCVSHMRGKNALVRNRLASKSASDIFVCSVVVAELWFGARNGHNPITERIKVDAFLAPFVSVPFDDLAAEQYSQIRDHLESVGMPISDLDMEIAAIALSRNLTVVTHNTAEFSRVPNLQLEDWEIP